MINTSDSIIVKVDLSDSWITSLSSNEVKLKIKDFFNKYKIKVVKSTSNQLLGKQGSQFKTRSSSGIWTDPAIFPKKIYIDLKDRNGNVEIDVKIEESLGFYLLTSGMKSKYKDYFEMLMKSLNDSIPELSEKKSGILIKGKNEEGIKYCGYCGTQIKKVDQKFCIECGKEIL